MRVNGLCGAVFTAAILRGSFHNCVSLTTERNSQECQVKEHHSQKE